MKIFVIGGTGFLGSNLVPRLVEYNHDVTVLTTHSDSTKPFENFEGIKIYRFGKKREQFLFKATLNLLKMKNKFDIVHTSTYSAMIPSFLFSTFKRVPKILSSHEVWSFPEWSEFMNKKGLFYFIEERILHFTI